MHKQVILYSGGMDSFMLAALYPEALKLYVDVGSKYAAKEMRYLPPDVVIDHNINLSEWERPDAIIPGRNLFMALVAAQYGDEILLGATAGDLSRDKDEYWSEQTSRLLSYMFSGAHFQNPRRHVTVGLPIKGKTKAELVAQYLRAGNPMLPLRDTVSCYHPEHMHCGHCKSCLRKWVALEYNGIVTGSIWTNDPRKAPDWEHIINAIRLDGWRTPLEDRQTLQVLMQHGVL